MPEGNEKAVNPSRKLADWEIAEMESKRIIKPDPSTITPDIDLAYCVAQFCHFYPSEFQNGQIGWARFWVMFYQLSRLSAMYRWNTATATRNGTGIFHTTDEGNRQLTQAIERDFRIATGLEKL